MHRIYKVPVATLAGLMASLSLSTAVVLNRARIARLVRHIRKDVARRNLNVQYAVRMAQIDDEAEMLSITFFDKHRAYFHKMVDYYQPVVAKRGQSLLHLRNMCRCTIAMLLLRDLARQHVSDLAKIDAKYAEKFTGAAQQIDDEAERLFKVMKRGDLPVEMIFAEYSTVS